MGVGSEASARTSGIRSPFRLSQCSALGTWRCTHKCQSAKSTVHAFASRELLGQNSAACNLKPAAQGCSERIGCWLHRKRSSSYVTRTTPADSAGPLEVGAGPLTTSSLLRLHCDGSAAVPCRAVAWHGRIGTALSAVGFRVGTVEHCSGFNAPSPRQCRPCIESSRACSSSLHRPRTDRSKYCHSSRLAALVV